MKIERQQIQLYLTQEEWDTLIKAQSICHAISRETANNNREDELEIYNTAIAIAIEIQNLIGIVESERII
ncbi:MAG: hypothetical protein WC961_07985 [Anaerovoracaceae bacterium]